MGPDRRRFVLSPVIPLRIGSSVLRQFEEGTHLSLFNETVPKYSELSPDCVKKGCYRLGRPISLSQQVASSYQ